MTPSAKRAKAKLLVEFVADKLRSIFPEFGEKDIVVPKTSDKGEDLKLSDEIRKMLPYSFEMKNQKGYAHVATDFEQTVKNSNGHTPILVVKSPYKDPLVIMRWDDFEKTLGQ